MSQVTLGPSFFGFGHCLDCLRSSLDLSDLSLILEIGLSSEVPCIMSEDPLPHLLAISANAYVASLSSTIFLFQFLVMTRICHQIDSIHVQTWSVHRPALNPVVYKHP